MFIIERRPDYAQTPKNRFDTSLVYFIIRLSHPSEFAAYQNSRCGRYRSLFLFS